MKCKNARTVETRLPARDFSLTHASPLAIEVKAVLWRVISAIKASE